MKNWCTTWLQLSLGLDIIATIIIDVVTTTAIEKLIITLAAATILDIVVLLLALFVVLWSITETTRWAWIIVAIR